MPKDKDKNKLNPPKPPVSIFQLPSPSSSSSNNTDGRSKQEFKAVVAAKAAAGIPFSEIKSTYSAQQLDNKILRNVFERNKPDKPATTSETTSTTTGATTTTTVPIEEAVDLYNTTSNGIGITEPELLAAQRGAELQTQSQISSYGWDAQKAIAALQQAGATERTKYEVDNKIPLVQAEAKGKIDLQKIVNAGYQNIARIERGSDMFRSIMGAFNF